MRAILQIEAIGDNHAEYRRLATGIIDEACPGLGRVVVGDWPLRYWVAEISASGERKLLRGTKDYSRANSVGSRRVYVCYLLTDGVVYEVSEPVSWKRNERYFCRVDRRGGIIKMSADEAQIWLQTGSAPSV